MRTAHSFTIGSIARNYTGCASAKAAICYAPISPSMMSVVN
jgi:hypothetical protein